MHFSAVEEQERYRQWIQDAKSSLLFLYGRTRAHDGDCCWLSAASRDLVIGARKRFHGTAVYLCQPSASADQGLTIEPILRDLAFQLLMQAGSKLSDASVHGQILKMVNATATTNREPGPAWSLLRQVVELFLSVFILIDRSDQIGGRASRWLEHLAGLLKNSNSTIHVVLIASANGNEEPGGKVGQRVISELHDNLSENFYALQMNDDD